MAVEVLSPQDCPKLPSSRGLLSVPMNYHRRDPNPPPNRAARPQSDRRKPQRKPAQSNASPVPLLNGPVKILKRGEELPKPTPPSKENRSPPKQNQKVPDLGSTVRSSPKPKKAPKQTRLADPVNPAIGFYAGMAYCVPSPPPSSLPLPSFFPQQKAGGSRTDEEVASGIRKLLGLNIC